MLYLTDQSPPKRDLKVSDPAVKRLSLSELQLAPASVLLLRFEDDSLNRMFPASQRKQLDDAFRCECHGSSLTASPHASR